ncbi:MAG: hypothetical protein E6538_13325 [Paeniclostridium sordellii]|nr:hypothetical protein [Paeniclostridium sordellii]
MKSIETVLINFKETILYTIILVIIGILNIYLKDIFTFTLYHIILLFIVKSLWCDSIRYTFNRRYKQPLYKKYDYDIDILKEDFKRLKKSI